MERSSEDQIKILQEKLDEAENQRDVYRQLAEMFENRLNQSHQAYEDARHRAELANEFVRQTNAFHNS